MIPELHRLVQSDVQAAPPINQGYRYGHGIAFQLERLDRVVTVHQHGDRKVQQPLLPGVKRHRGDVAQGHTTHIDGPPRTSLAALVVDVWSVDLRPAPPHQLLQQIVERGAHRPSLRCVVSVMAPEGCGGQGGFGASWVQIQRILCCSNSPGGFWVSPYRAANRIPSGCPALRPCRS